MTLNSMSQFCLHISACQNTSPKPFMFCLTRLFSNLSQFQCQMSTNCADVSTQEGALPQNQNAQSNYPVTPGPKNPSKDLSF